MQLKISTLRMLFEGAEAAGIPRERLAGTTFDLRLLADASGRVSWTRLTELCGRASELLGHDPERLRDIGAGMMAAPSNAFIQKVARGMVSPRALHEVGVRWVAPTLFPHLTLGVEFDGGDMRMKATIPEPYEPSAPFFHIFQGSVCETTRLLGLPRATLVRSEVTPRLAEFVVRLPPARSLRARGGRAIRRLLPSGVDLEALEEQRKDLQRSVDEYVRHLDDFRRVLDGLPDPVCIHRDGTLLWVNRTLLELLGYAAQSDLVGAPLRSIVHESSHAVMRERIQTPPTGQRALEQVKLLRRDGGGVTVELSPARRIEFEGAPARLVVGRDTSERVRLQERLVTADRLSSLGLLAAGVAHEINNPIAYILGSLEILRRELDRCGAPPGADDALTRAFEGVARVRTIVRDLQTLSRADVHMVQHVDVRAALDATLDLTESEIRARARIVREYQETPEARVNAARLGQVILNLVINAIEAMPDVGNSNNELVVRTWTDAAGRPVLAISDTGTGIAPELTSRIFDPFFTTKPRGTGLGLAICHELVAEAGGEIAVDSTPGKGTTFRVTLPAASAPP